MNDSALYPLQIRLVSIHRPEWIGCEKIVSARCGMRRAFDFMGFRGDNLYVYLGDAVAYCPATKQVNALSFSIEGW